MGRSKKVFGKSQKRPNGDIRSLLFKKKRTAEAALDALGAKLAAQYQAPLWLGLGTVHQHSRVSGLEIQLPRNDLPW